jgi:N-acetylglucosaminyl-diphospho-decaprenol L-rhamnosyltransferase
MRCSAGRVPPVPRVPADPTELSAIIVTYNSAAHIGRCLHALSAGMGPDRSWEATVVDNASRDDTTAIVGEQFPWVKLIRLERNLGLAHGNNRGIRESRGRYLLVLNPDVSISPDGAGRMMRFLDEHPEIGTLGCQLVYPDGGLQYSCRTFPTPLTVAVRRSFLGRVGPTAGILRHHLMMDVDHGEVRPVDWLLGACLMVRRAALEDIGGFDESYRLYCEDVDLCFRLWERGWEVVYYPEVRAEHAYARESARRWASRRAFEHLRSMWIYLWRHHQWGALGRRNPRLGGGRA